ncbi:MAG: hypothetical protein NTY31_00700 [Candidatus Falkowbacteria bacterium]|nr:hypothetical protein [Candidatus Falkowbacteria bacterium]
MNYTKLIKTNLIGLGALVFCLLPLLAQAQTDLDLDFNSNRILEDSEILNYSSMGLLEIQNFLQNKGSYLVNYSTLNTHGDMKSAAEIIYDATHNNYDCEGITLSDQPTEAEKKSKCRQITTINPKFLLILLQKEASLVTDSAPPQDHLDWATGYGCPDSWVCNPYYKGFGKQVNSASLQFLDYMQDPQAYNFKVGQTYIAKDKYSILKSMARAINDGDYNSIIASPEMVSVTPANQATAALYNYTPHVFNGNYNIYKLWNTYFPKVSRLYPDGSIIKADWDPRVWLIANGQKRHFANWSAFVSRFRPEQIVTVTGADLENYPLGDEIKFANYSLVQTPDKKIYLLVDQEKRPFASLAVFKNIGFNPEEIETATVADLTGYSLGKAITATSTYVTGALLQDSKTGEIFYVENGRRALVDKVLLNIKFIGKKIILKTTTQLKVYATTTPILLDEGTLVRTNTYPTVYLISNGKKRPFADDATFNKLGYNPQNIVTVSSKFLYNYDMGEAIQ